MTADRGMSRDARATGAPAAVLQAGGGGAPVALEHVAARSTPGVPRPIYERVLPAVTTSVSQIREELDDALQGLDVDPARRADIALVVAEAAANAVMHAYVDMPCGPLEVSAAAFDRNLEIRISDRGRGMLPRSGSTGLGVGLVLMSRLSSVLEVFECDGDCGTEVVVVFEDAIPATQSPPPSRAARPAERSRDGSGAVHDY